MAGIWNSLTNQPTFSAGTMLLLTDGSVLCHDEPNWAPSPAPSTGGAWSPTRRGATGAAPGTRSPTVLGRPCTSHARCCATGVCSSPGASTTATPCRLKSPRPPSMIRSPMRGPPSASHRLDADRRCAVGDPGRRSRVLGDINGKRSAIYDPVANTWTAARDQGRCTLHGGNVGDPPGSDRSWRSNATTNRRPRNTSPPPTSGSARERQR